MKWGTHISKMCSKANSTLGFIKRNLKYAPKTLKVTAYKSLVRSKLEYGCTVWDPHLKKDIDKIEMVQRRAARFVCRDYGRESSVTEMLRSLDWPTLEQRRKDKRINMLNNIVTGSVAIPKDQFVTLGQTRTRSKNDNKIAVYRTSTEEFKNSFPNCRLECQ